MIRTLTLVLALAIAGDVVVGVLAVPVPGAALGMMLLAFWFVIGGPDRDSEQLFDATAPHFPLFFIPAAVGVVASADALAQAWIHILIAVVLGTAATIAVTAVLAQALLNRIGKVRLT